MKYLFFILLLFGGVASAQTTYYIQADSTRLRKVGANNELIVENGTRTRTGAYLKNTLNGRTGFFYAVDSAYISGSNLVLVRGGGTQNVTVAIGTAGNVWSITGNSGTAPGTNFLGTTDSVDLVGKTKSLERFRWNARGALGLGTGTDYGTSGYLLKTNGAASAPTWVDPATLVTATPTWQQVLTAGSTLTQTNNIEADIANNHGITFGKATSFGSFEFHTDGLFYANSLLMYLRGVDSVSVETSGLIHLRDSSIYGTSATNGHVWTLIDDTDGEGTWKAPSTVATSVPLSGITAATGTNTINSGTFAQEWQWNTLAGNSALKLSTTSTAAAGGTQVMLDIQLSGTNATSSQNTKGINVSNTHDGSSSDNVGVYSAATSGTSSNTAILGTATGTTSKGVYGINTTAGSQTGQNTSSGVYGYASASGASNSVGVFGYSLGNTGKGIYGYNGATGYGGYFENEGVTGTGYALYATKTGGATTNIAGYFTASGATTNRAIEVGAGDVVIAGLADFPDTSYKAVVINTATNKLYKATYWPGGGGTVTGSGTDNYIPRWNGTTALENSVIYDDGTNIGIGNASPAKKLDVTGNGRYTYNALAGDTALIVAANTTAAASNAQVGVAVRLEGANATSTQTTTTMTIENLHTGTGASNRGLLIRNTGVTGSSNYGLIVESASSGNYGAGILLKPLGVSDPYSPVLKFAGTNGSGGLTTISTIGNDYGGHLTLDGGNYYVQFASPYSGVWNVRIRTYVYSTGAAPDNYVMNIRTPSTTSVGLMIDRGAASQSEDLLQFRKSDKTVLSRFDSIGYLGIGTVPVAPIHVIKTTEQLRLGYDASNYYSTTVGSTGGVTFNAVGAGSAFTFSDNLDVTGVVSTDGLNADRTITAGGTTGNQTINKMAGTVNFAAAATTLTVTNSLVDANSIIFCVVRTNDATATIKNVVPGSGSFVITLTAAATAETSVGFIVTN